MALKNKAVFLDRDGVINIDKGYVFKINDFDFVDKIFKVLNYFKDDYLLFIITNQSGVARGYYSEKDIKILHQWLTNNLAKKGISIQEIFYCPHHPKFDFECNCRKPKPGMIINAKNKYNLDLNNSILIGDKSTDIESGKNAGILNLIKVEKNDLSNALNFIIEFNKKTKDSI